MLRFRELEGKKDYKLLRAFLEWLTPEAYKTWHHWGNTFSRDNIMKILLNEELKIVGTRKEDGKEKIIVLGHLYSFREKTCRLGIVTGEPGKGYGTEMMVELERRARKEGVQKIYLSCDGNNLSAVNLYKKRGFKKIKTYTDRKGERNYEMVKPLVRKGKK